MEITKQKLFYFEGKHAVNYGVNAAILINYFKFFIECNIKLDMAGKRKAGNNSYREGRTYSYISKSNLANHFFFFTEAQVKHALDKLVTAGVLVTACHNKKKYDRTLWYAFRNEEEFLDLPIEYIKFKQAEAMNSDSIDVIKPGSDELPNQPHKSSLDKNNQEVIVEPGQKQMDKRFLADEMENSPQSIGENSPTIPVNETITNNKENTYIPNCGEFNSSTCSMSDEVVEGELDNELLIWLNMAHNRPASKVGSMGFSAAYGSSQNVDEYCSIEDTDKLSIIFTRYCRKEKRRLKYLHKWHEWVKTKQENPNEIKHESAWIKSYLRFAEKNSVIEQAEKQEELRKKKEDELARRPKYTQNPYNDMCK